MGAVQDGSGMGRGRWCGTCGWNSSVEELVRDPGCGQADAGPIRYAARLRNVTGNLLSEVGDRSDGVSATVISGVGHGVLRSV